MYIEIAAFVVGLGIGGVTGRKMAPIKYVTHDKLVEKLTYSMPAPRPTSPGRKQVVFRYKDGTEDVKSMFEHSLSAAVPWRGRKFLKQANKGEFVLYTEE